MTMIDKTPDRAEVRRQLRALRKRFVADLPRSARNLAFRVLPSPVLAPIPPESCIALYHPIGSEAPANKIAAYLFDLGFPLCLPRLGMKADDPHYMDFAAWTPDDMLVPGPSRIPQPDFGAESVQPDIVFTPLVGFDAALNRLGQGAGHYDRAFAEMQDVIKIGLAWSCQQVDALAVEPWDVPLDLIVTEQRIFARDAE